MTSGEPIDLYRELVANATDTDVCVYTHLKNTAKSFSLIQMACVGSPGVTPNYADIYMRQAERTSRFPTHRKRRYAGKYLFLRQPHSLTPRAALIYLRTYLPKEAMFSCRGGCACLSA